MYRGYLSILNLLTLTITKFPSTEEYEQPQLYVGGHGWIVDRIPLPVLDATKDNIPPYQRRLNSQLCICPAK